jgi:CBS domain-containing protein
MRKDFLPMNIEQIMSQPVASCRERDSLHTAAQLMWEHDCGAVPVLDHEGKLIGMVTDRDICMATFTQGKAPQDICVADVMSKQVFACHPGDSLESAELLMSEKQIRRLPVVNGSREPLGMLSLNDIARYGASTRKKNGMDHQVVQTMAAICEPRHSAIQQQPSA